MKCDELKPITVTDECGSYRVYNKSEVDAAIAELKQKLQDQCISCPIKMQEDDVVAEFKEKLEDAGMRERKLKRALWLARASEAAKEVNYWTCQDESSYAIVDFNIRHETIVSYKAPHHRPYKWVLIWENVERKCRAKMEEYK